MKPEIDEVQDIDFDALFKPDYEADDGNKDRLTHIFNPPANTHIWKPGMTTQEMVDQARTFQIEITALCGHKIIPKFNPDTYDICRRCVDLANVIIKEMG